MAEKIIRPILTYADEVHRAGAGSYQKIMNYFEPKLWLGMTASPDRTDGFDIYNLFDHNIAYEIRLQQALEEVFFCPLLCPTQIRVRWKSPMLLKPRSEMIYTTI